MASENQALARGLRRRDPELLDHLIEQFRFRLFRYLIYLTNHQESAEELFQETWVRVLERGHQYSPKWKFQSWLFTIAHNLFIDQQRRRGRRPDFADDHGEPEQAPEGPEVPSALDRVVRQEQGERVQAALSHLPAPYREVLALRFQEEMSLEEIAAVAAIPLATVKSRLYRALENLRQRLETKRT